MGINLPKLRTSIQPCFLQLLDFRGDITFCRRTSLNGNNHLTIVLFQHFKKIAKVLCKSVMETWLLSLRCSNLTQPPPASGAKSEQQHSCIEQEFVSFFVCSLSSSVFCFYFVLLCFSFSLGIFLFSHTFVCTQPFYLCKLGDTTFS